MILENKKAIAKELGRLAYNKDAKRIFALDQEAGKYLQDVLCDENIKIMDAWYKGYDNANLRAPIK